MKNTTILTSLLLIAISFPALAVKKISTAERLAFISKEMKSVDACENHFEPRDFHPSTFGKDNQKVSILAFAANGNVMVGNDTKAFQLILNKGMIQAVNNGKMEKITYSIDPKLFLKQLTSMNQFLNQALAIAQKEGNKKDVEHVSCAVAIVESAKKYHNVKA